MIAMSMTPTDANRLVSIPFAARHSGTPERTFRRRMHAMNDLAEGRLLIPAGGRQRRKVGKWLVCLAVLDEVAPTRATKRAATLAELEELELELREVQEQIEILQGRTNGHSARLRQHERKLKNRAPVENTNASPEKA